MIQGAYTKPELTKLGNVKGITADWQCSVPTHGHHGNHGHHGHGDDD